VLLVQLQQVIAEWFEEASALFATMAHEATGRGGYVCPTLAGSALKTAHYELALQQEAED